MPRTKGKKQLSQARILSAAVKYADKNGIDSLNMRQLAKQLDAGVMSLYHYFSNKDELLDAMVDWVAGKINRSNSDVDWRTAITEISVSLYQLMKLHTWVAAIWNQRTLGPNKLAYMESILKVLRENGFSVPLACDAYHAFTAHIEGFSLQVGAFPIKEKDVNLAAEEFLSSVENPKSIPYFFEHVQHHLDQTEFTDQFGLILEMILDGFEARLSGK